MLMGLISLGEAGLVFINNLNMDYNILEINTVLISFTVIEIVQC